MQPSLAGKASLHDTCCYAQKERLGAAEAFVNVIGDAEKVGWVPKKEVRGSSALHCTHSFRFVCCCFGCNNKDSCGIMIYFSESH